MGRAAFLARSRPSRKDRRAERAAFLARSRPSGKGLRAAAFLARSRPSRKDLRAERAAFLARFQPSPKDLPAGGGGIPGPFPTLAKGPPGGKGGFPGPFSTLADGPPGGKGGIPGPFPTCSEGPPGGKGRHSTPVLNLSGRGPPGGFMRNRLQHIPLGALRAPCFPCKIYPHICLGARRAAGAPGVPGIQKKCERGIPAREICKSRTYVKKNPPAAVARSINISGKTLFVLRALGHAWPVLNLSGRTSGWKGAAFLASSEPSRKHLQVERATSLAVLGP